MVHTECVNTKSMPKSSRTVYAQANSERRSAGRSLRRDAEFLGAIKAREAAKRSTAKAACHGAPLLGA